MGFKEAEERLGSGSTVIKRPFFLQGNGLHVYVHTYTYMCTHTDTHVRARVRMRAGTHAKSKEVLQFNVQNVV